MKHDKLELYSQVTDAGVDLGESKGYAAEVAALEMAVRAAYDLLGYDDRRSFFQSTEYEDVIDWLSDDRFTGNELEDVIAGAKQHGQDSEPDHACGDLQDLLRILIDILPEAKLPELHSTETVAELVQKYVAPAAYAPR